MRMSDLHAEMEEAMKEAELDDFMAWVNERENLGQPSPVNDGILKGNENGLHRI